MENSTEMGPGSKGLGRQRETAEVPKRRGFWKPQVAEKMRNRLAGIVC